LFPSIRWRIAAAFVVLVVLCISGLSVFLVHHFEDSYLDDLRVQLANQARLVAVSASETVRGGELGEIAELAHRLGEQTSARITIVGTDGTVLGDSEEDPSEMDNHSDRPEVVAALEEGEGSAIRHSATLGYDMFYVAVPIEAGAEVVAVSRVALSLADVGKAMDGVARMVIVGALVSAAVTVLLAILVSRVTVRPLRELTRVSRRMTDGQLDQEAAVESADEVGELAVAFNQMARRIRDMVDQLTAERDRMAAVLAEMSDGILVVDPDTRVSTANPAARGMLGLSKGQALGLPLAEMIWDYELVETVKRCLEKGVQQSASVETSPRKRLLWVVATPLHSESGCLVLLRDMTELRRLETIRRDFVSNISHELRTPIASVKAIAETLQQGAIEDGEVARDFLAKINAEADRLAQMVQELSDLSRIESGQARMDKGPFDMGATVQRAVERLKAQSDRAGIVVNVDVAPDTSQAWGDADRIEQVLVNVLHNAVKFTPTGGRISISVGTGGQGITVSVADTGVGIPADDLPRVFERFYKTDRSRSGGGTGLGLAIAKHIVEAHGGRIWAESVEGRGSTFTFTIPLAPGR